LVWTGPSSPLFCQEVLAQLAILQGAGQPAIEPALIQAREEAAGGSRLIVISPRSAEAAGVEPGEDLVWIDVSQPGLESLFTLE
jgi:hypothetical protein